MAPFLAILFWLLSGFLFTFIHGKLSKEKFETHQYVGASILGPFMACVVLASYIGGEYSE